MADQEARSRIVHGEDPNRVRTWGIHGRRAAGWANARRARAWSWNGPGTVSSSGDEEEAAWRRGRGPADGRLLPLPATLVCSLTRSLAVYSLAQFYCPHPGCSRSFAELWRLKVHFRAPPDVRGSGKERGHGTELKFCPKCGKELKPGKHHVGCAGGKSAPRQAAKRRRMPPLSSSDADDDAEANQSSHSSSWQRLVDGAVARRRTSRMRAADADKEDSVVLVQGQAGPSGKQACKVDAMEDIKLDDNLLGHGMNELHSDMLPNLMDTAEARAADHDMVDSGLAAGLAGELERLPSPPPIPPDWELGGEIGSAQFLFDFGQFDVEKSRDRRHSALLEEQPEIRPHTTAVSAMQPDTISTPSDDYIWQVLFANPTDEVPKRVTAHMHNPATHDAALHTLPDVGQFDPVFPTILSAARAGASGRVAGVPAGAGKKKVTVTYEVGDDGVWNPTDVKHDGEEERPDADRKRSA